MRHISLLTAIFAIGLLILPFVYSQLDIEDSELRLGSNTQYKYEGSNLKLFTEVIDIRNNEQKTVGNLQPDFTLDDDIDSQESEFNLTFTNLNINISPSSTGSVTMRIQVPEDFDAVDEDLVEESFYVGDLRFSADIFENESDVGDASSDVLKIYMQIENGIDIVSVQIDKGGGATSVSSGSTYQVNTGDDLDLIIKVKNKFDSGTEDFEDVDIKVESEDLDIDEDSSIDEIQANSEKEETLDINIGDETGVFDVEILVFAEDKGSGLHGEKFTFKLDVKESESSEDEQIDQEDDDSDNDGVSDLNDFCPLTEQGCVIDSQGCEIDTDNDGICDGKDTDNNQQIQQQIQQQINQESSLKDQEEKNDTEKSSSIRLDKSFGIIPFVIGFVVGIVITSVFFMLIKS